MRNISSNVARSTMPETAKGKTCTKCKMWRLLKFYYAQKRGRLGRSSRCKDCHRDWARVRHSLRPDRRKKNWQRWYAKNWKAYSQRRKAKRDADPAWHEAHRAKRKEWQRNNAAAIKERAVCRQFKILPEQYRALVKLQGNRCGICRKKILLCVDHDHTTGKVRGLLCRKCNSGVGILGDTKRVVKRAYAYLTEPPFNEIRKAA